MPGTLHLQSYCLYSYSYSYGLYSYSYSYGLYIYGLYSYGLYSYGPYSYGLYSYGPYSYGLYSYGLEVDREPLPQPLQPLVGRHPAAFVRSVDKQLEACGGVILPEEDPGLGLCLDACNGRRQLAVVLGPNELLDVLESMVHPCSHELIMREFHPPNKPRTDAAPAATFLPLRAYIDDEPCLDDAAPTLDDLEDGDDELWHISHGILVMAY